jgi:hypothetical protein
MTVLGSGRRIKPIAAGELLHALQIQLDLAQRAA